MLFELPHIEHATATSVAQVVSLLREHGDAAAVNAGSTDLLGLLKDKVEGPELKIPRILIDIKPVAELNLITEGRKGLKIGAAVSLSRLMDSDTVRKHFPALAQAAGRVGTTQLRNMGTLGGNLCQRPRCLYFRHPHFLCFKKGGRKCFAVAGEHRDYHAILEPGKCVMAHPSDLAPVLIALKARGIIAGPEGERTVTLQDFFADANSRRETVLRRGELLKEVHLDRPPAAGRQVFLKQGLRQAADFALASVAAAAVISDGICREISLVLGGVAPLPLVAESAEKLLQDRKPDGDLFARAAEAALEGAKPLPGNRYKVDLAKALVRRALALVAGEGEAAGAASPAST
jgi:xanthine dehydrogenase YagS FAD-binding subunit